MCGNRQAWFCTLTYTIFVYQDIVVQRGRRFVCLFLALALQVFLGLTGRVHGGMKREYGMGDHTNTGTEGLLRSSRSISRSTGPDSKKSCSQDSGKDCVKLITIQTAFEKMLDEEGTWAKGYSFQRHSRLMRVEQRRLAFNSVSTLIHSELYTENILTQLTV